MLPLSPSCTLLLLGFFAFCASCGYVQTQPCDGVVDNGLSTRSSLTASVKNSVLSLEVRSQHPDVPCDEAATDFLAHLEVFRLRHQLQYNETGHAQCQSYNYSRTFSQEYLVFPMTFDLGSLPPLTTLDLRLQLQTPESQNLGCLQAVVTPAMSNTTSATVQWIPCAIFIFVLLVGVLRGFNERIHGFAGASSTSDLNLPDVGDLLSYLQFMFLSATLSLHYPGFFQPAVSKLNLFSLFTTGPIVHGRVYRGIEDGIYAINGTYGGTGGLEHMHQIVGAPPTMITWYNFVIAILIVSAVAGLFLEVVTFCRRRFERKYFQGVPGPTSQKLSFRIIAILRLTLSYFTLPLSAMSFYQLSAAAWFPVYHTVSATFLIIACILAFIWLFRRLPAQSAGRLIHGVPKWYQKEVAQSSPYGNCEADKFFATLAVVLTFIRGAVIGGLQMYGPVQLAILGACELCLLLVIRWLRAYSIFTVGTIAPIFRLIILLLMISFARGLADGPVRSAIGYFILAMHAAMIIFGFFFPTVYHFWNICRSVARHLAGNSYSNRPFDRNNDIEHSSSSVALAHMQRHSGDPRPPSSSDGQQTPALSEPLDSPRSPGFSTYGYFRQPRHSSVRSTSGDTKAVSVISMPSQASTAYDPGAEMLPSSSHSDSVDDPWHDTRSTPLGPRWNDYTYREGDSFYGAPPQKATLASASSKITSRSSLPNMHFHGRMSAVGDTLSSIKETIISSLSPDIKTPEADGFQVVRPPRQSAQLMPEQAPEGTRAGYEDSISSE